MQHIKVFPKRLNIGDEIRVISPSSSMERVGGFENNIPANDQFGSSSIKERIDDLHDVFADSNVKAILTTIGGLNSNELLPYIDWDLIKNNPKFFYRLF